MVGSNSEVMSMSNLSPEIQKIRTKLISAPWPRFIHSIEVSGLHGFATQKMEFKFPITAIVGENGTGKSTFLKLAASVYQAVDESGSFYPSQFFPTTVWDRLQNIRIDYDVQRGPQRIKHTIKKETTRWRGIDHRMENRVYYFDLTRTQPIETLIGYSKLAKEKIREVSAKPLPESDLSSVVEIMGRTYEQARYAKTDVDSRKEVGILKTSFGEMSQFHQGTGEAIISNFIHAIENIPDYSLIVIDEIESSLHPKAQRRLVNKLLNLVRVKNLQIIVSTHSPYVLSELPSEARILLVRKISGIQITYGASVAFCLSNLDDVLHPELLIAVEDQRAGSIVSQFIRELAPDIIQRVEIIHVGAANLVSNLGELAGTGRLPVNLISILDADQTTNSYTIKLPGQYSPEKQIILDIKQGGLTKLQGLLGGDMQLIQAEFEELVRIQDYSSWVGRLSSRFKIAEDTLWGALVLIWVKERISRQYPEDAELVRKIKEGIQGRTVSNIQNTI